MNNPTPSLRPYQAAAVEAVRQYLRDGRGAGRRGPVVTMPTGSGKSVVAAELAMRAFAKGNPVLVLTHRKELLIQNRAALIAVRPEIEWESCLYSAGAREKRLDRPVVFAGVQSLCNADRLPPFGVVLVDECHRVPPILAPAEGKEEEERGQYARAVALIRAARGGSNPVWLGLSATPYRSDGGGYLWEQGGSIFDGEAYHVGMGELIRDGYLSPLTPAPAWDAHDQMDASQLRVGRDGDYTRASQEAAISEGLMSAIVRGAIGQMEREGRRGVMVFTPTKRITTAIAAMFRAAEIPTVHVLGDTDWREREHALAAFRRQQARVIVSCGVLTEGFDAPHVDVVVLARAMRSPGLYVQVCGRGSRVAEGKRGCSIRDHGHNLARHGPPEQVQPQRYVRRAGKRRRGSSDRPDPEWDEKQLAKLSADPSAAATTVGQDWRRVVAVEAEPGSSKRGNPMVAVRYTLEGRPRYVREWILTAPSAKWMRGKFRDATGHWPGEDPARNADTACIAAHGVRAVRIQMSGKWPEVIERRWSGTPIAEAHTPRAGERMDR